MSGYIINPLWFYWLQVADGVSVFLVAVSVVLFMFSAIVLLVSLADMYVGEDSPIINFLKAAKVSIIIAPIALLIALLIPSKETMIQMELARHITYENVEMIVEQITEATDYIIDRIKE